MGDCQQRRILQIINGLGFPLTLLDQKIAQEVQDFFTPYIDLFTARTTGRIPDP
jgi:hypothetical protein